MKTENLQFGYISRAHGLKGELVLRTFDPASDVINDLDVLVLELRDGQTKTFTLEGVRTAPKNDILISFEEVNNRPHADKLVGAKVFVRREDLGELEEGEHFQGDMLGLKAVDEQGNALGVLEEIWNTGPVPNLVIRAEGKPELVVPYAEEFVPKLDMESRVITIKVPEYLE